MNHQEPPFDEEPIKSGPGNSPFDRYIPFIYRSLAEHRSIAWINAQIQKVTKPIDHRKNKSLGKWLKTRKKGYGGKIHKYADLGAKVATPAEIPSLSQPTDGPLAIDTAYAVLEARKAQLAQRDAAAAASPISIPTSKVTT
jgi:hypothetical protein